MVKLILLVALQLGAPDKAFTLAVEAAPAKRGQHAVATVKVTPGAGFHMNKEYPTSLALTAPAGVTLDRQKLVARDAKKLEEAGAVFEVGYTAAAAGKQVLKGELKFAVCTSSSCDPKRSSFNLDLDIK